MEVKRLISLGMITINRDKLASLKDCKLLIRAHGEPPETYRIAQEQNITIIEATCPIVKKLQARVKETWLRQRRWEVRLSYMANPDMMKLLDCSDIQIIMAFSFQVRMIFPK
jgi:hypothetical protein